MPLGPGLAPTIMKTPLAAVTALVLLSAAAIQSQAQTKKDAPACSRSGFAAFRALPKLEYECPDNPNDSDDRILRLPQRVRAIRVLIRSLEQFSATPWWQTSVDELNACALHGQAGELTDDEKEKWRSGDYTFELFGNNQMRLVLLDDPCYQTGYNGSNAFLLNWKGGRVFVSHLLDGYYSRVDNSVGIDFARLNGRQIIEVATANSMPPSYWNYYFEIDPATNKALPKKLFREGRKLTDRIYSDMLMSEPEELGLPKTASELRIIVNGRLAKSFSAYEQSPDERGIDANGRKLRRIIYRWNGRYYSPR